MNERSLVNIAEIAVIDTMPEEQARAFLRRLFKILYIEAGQFNPEKEWDSDTLGEIGTLMHDSGLAGERLTGTRGEGKLMRPRVFLRRDDIDRHGEGCSCGACDSIGKSYGVAIRPVEDADADPLARIYGPSDGAALLSALAECRLKGWQPVAFDSEQRSVSGLICLVCGNDSFIEYSRELCEQAGVRIDADGSPEYADAKHAAIVEGGGPIIDYRCEECDTFFSVVDGRLARNLENEFAPEVKAEVHSDDHAVTVSFNAAPWFEQATDAEILALAECDWANDYPADAVAQFMADLDHRVHRLFEYLDFAPRMPFSNDVVGYCCSVDPETAAAWIAIHRPSLRAAVGAEASPL